MSTGDDTPLTAPGSSVYTERNVWQNTAGMKALYLTHDEHSEVQGTFATGAAGSGPYREDVHYALHTAATMSRISPVFRTAITHGNLLFTTIRFPVPR
jgi:hypothetical protein